MIESGASQDGNPHPMPGHLIPDNLPFVLLPYPMIGWNDAPLAPPHPLDNPVEAGWGNAHWGEEEDNNQLPQPAVP